MEILRREGRRSLWFKLLGELGYRRLYVVERPLDATLAESRCSLPLRLELLTERGVSDYLKHRAPGVCNPVRNPLRRDVAGRLDAGQYCFVTYYRGHMVGSIWAARAWVDVPYLRMEFQPAPGSVYLYDNRVDPELRGRGVAQALTHYAREGIKHWGFVRTVGLISPENLASLRASQRAGSRVVARVGYLRMGPWRWMHCRRLVDGSLSPHGLPAFRLKAP
ncbi:MAG: GNAT family N-acetyltransferase [Salinisphaera sp.]|nr:GNAT family N-acetyltransferase [Salinisphaera sp.]